MPPTRIIPSQVDVISRAHAGLVTACGLLVLQRRGFTSEHETMVGKDCHVLIRAAHHPKGWLDVVMSAATRIIETVRTTAEADDVAARFASEVLGTDLRPAPFTAAYMYQTRPFPVHPDVAENDRIVSPLRYDPGSDTVRTAGTNVCVAHFPDGTFASARPFDDALGREVWPHVARALSGGFPPCCIADGDDACRRRLAWLAGAYWLSAADLPLRCDVLQRDMTRSV